MMSILSYPTIENHKLITSMETINELQRTYGLTTLPQWVNPEKIPDFVQANLSPPEFSLKKIHRDDRFALGRREDTAD